MNKILTKANQVLKIWVNSRNKTNLEFFGGTTIVSHGDGSHFVFQNSNARGIIINNIKLVLVASEHCGDHVFFAEDLERWQYFVDGPFQLFEK